MPISKTAAARRGACLLALAGLAASLGACGRREEPRGAPAGDDSTARLMARLMKSGCTLYCNAPLEGAVYPAGFPPPTFRWTKAIMTKAIMIKGIASSSPKAAPVQLRVSSGGRVIHAEQLRPWSQSWTPPRKLWEGWTGKTLTVELSGSDERGPYKALPITFAIDTHSLPDDVFVRILSRVTPPDRPPSVHIRFVWLDPISQKRRTIMNFTRNCVGCHSTGRKTNAIWFVRVKTYPVYQRSLAELRPAARGARATVTMSPPASEIRFPQPSPAEDKVVCSVSLSSGLLFLVGNFRDFDASVGFNGGDLDASQGIAIYDVKTRALAPLPGAASPDYNADYPSWSPDGAHIAFQRFRYPGRMDICVVPYNGGRGGAARPLRGASGNGWDNYCPEYSPDGRWIAFNRGDASGGVFARDSSEIYLVPARGGAARRLEFNAEGKMNSWHFWSSDSRWLLYSSKRDGIATRAYIARIYEDGRAGMPVPLDCGAGPFERVNMPVWIKKGELAPVSAEEFEAPPGS